MSLFAFGITLASVAQHFDHGPHMAQVQQIVLFTGDCDNLVEFNNVPRYMLQSNRHPVADFGMDICNPFSSYSSAYSMVAAGNIQPTALSECAKKLARPNSYTKVTMGRFGWRRMIAAPAN